MMYGTNGSATRGSGIAKAATWLLERVGLLNPGSSKAAAAPTTADAERVGPVASNALNVTRVGGFAAFVTTVGAAALGIFGVEELKGATERAAAYASVGAIVAAALIAAAIIVVADIRARAAIATTTPANPSSNHSIQIVEGKQITEAMLDTMEETTLVSAEEGDVTLKLPSAMTYPNQKLTVRRIDKNGTHIVRFDPNCGLDLPDLTGDQEMQLYSSDGRWHELAHT